MIGRRKRKLIKKRITQICFMFLICGMFLYGMKDIGINFDMRELSNDLNYRYDANGYAGLDITLNTLKEGETYAKQNTKELQAAINKVSESGGGTVYLPSGTYYFGPGGYNNTTDKEDFAIKCRDNVHLKGKGTDENSSSYTILKPYYNEPGASGGMDMFYFNNYKDSGFKSTSYNTSSIVNVSYIDASGKTVTWNNQHVYLINADFSDFVIDGDSARGGIATAGGTYRTDGKGFMINLFSDCDWNNVVVKNVDATGFGVDCPINSTIKNCKAINCGKAATQNDGGASGFGIGTGYSNEESLVIENSIAINNKKFGFFFEHQAKFSDTHYKATGSKGFVVTNSVAGGNMYDFGGLKSHNVTYENNYSVSNQGTYKVEGLKATNTQPGTYKYTSLTFSNGKVNLNKTTQPIYFSEYSSNSFAVNTKVYGMLTDITSAETEIKWAVDSGIIPVSSVTKFGSKETITRMDIVKILYAYTGREYPIKAIGRTTERKQYKEQISKIGFTDLDSVKYQDELDSVLWAYNKGIISQDKLFNPETSCTRAQFVTMLYRMEGSPTISGLVPFKDVKVGSYYYNAVLWGYQKGLIMGTSTNEFSPDEKITKTQLATFLYRYKNISSRSFKLKVNIIGGTGYNPSEYSKTGNITLNNPSRTGYTFLGWTGSNGVTPTKNVVIKPGTTGNLSYTANWSPNLINLFIKEEASIKTFKVGSKLDTKGLVVAAKYGDNNIYDITNYTISPTVLDKVGNQIITINYGGLSANYSVTVTDNPISKISVSKKPNNVEYYVGDKIDTTGLELKVYYEDGTSKIIKDGYTINPVEINKAGTSKVTVKYNGKTTSFEVFAKDIELTSIKIKTYPTKLNYYVGEYINTDGLVITTSYSNGITKELTEGYELDTYFLNEVGEVTITVKYETKTCKFKVNVKKENITEIKVYELPKKISYYVGEKFTSKGLKIAVLKDSGYKEVISSGFKLSIDEGHTFKEKGNYTVKVSYGKFTTTFDLKIYDSNDKVLNILKRPNKTNYVVGEKFKSEGLVVELISPDTLHVNIKDYKLSLDEGTILTTAGVKTITVAYKNYTTSFNINVSKVVSIEVNKASKKLTYNVGETFSIEDVAVIAQYEDGIKEKLDKQYKVEVQGGNKLSTPGEKEVIVTYGDVTTKFRINVEEGTTNESKSTMNIFIVLGVVLVVFITILVTLVRKKDKLNNQQKIKD